MPAHASWFACLLNYTTNNMPLCAASVHQGTLPFRALALRYGADTVFTEEVIDRRVVNAVRTENPVLETIDYVEGRGKKGNATPFQTCPALERGRVVYQVGTGDATNALRAAQASEKERDIWCCAVLCYAVM